VVRPAVAVARWWQNSAWIRLSLWPMGAGGSLKKRRSKNCYPKHLRQVI